MPAARARARHLDGKCLSVCLSVWVRSVAAAAECASLPPLTRQELTSPQLMSIHFIHRIGGAKRMDYMWMKSKEEERNKEEEGQQTGIRTTDGQLC